MQNRKQEQEPATIADVIEELCDDYGLQTDQRISTLIKASADDEFEDDDYEDEDDVEDEDD